MPSNTLSTGPMCVDSWHLSEVVHVCINQYNFEYKSIVEV